MITALIFAGGSGKRMNTRSKPKQFLEVYGKPIIISTVELKIAIVSVIFFKKSFKWYLLFY